MTDGYLSIWGPPKPKGGHVVATIRFLARTPADEALMECKCGWSGIVGEWEAHGGRVSRAPSDVRPAPPRPRPVKDVCTVNGCLKLQAQRGLCGGHYSRLRAGLTVDQPLRHRRTPIDTPWRNA